MFSPADLLAGQVVHLPAPPWSLLVPLPDPEFQPRAGCAHRGRVVLTESRSHKFLPNFCNTWGCRACAQKKLQQALCRLCILVADESLACEQVYAYDTAPTLLKRRAQSRGYAIGRVTFTTPTATISITSHQLGSDHIYTAPAPVSPQFLEPFLRPSSRFPVAPFTLPGVSRIQWAGSWSLALTPPDAAPLIRDTDRAIAAAIHDLAVTRASETFQVQPWRFVDSIPDEIPDGYWAAAVRRAGGQMGQS